MKLLSDECHRTSWEVNLGSGNGLLPSGHLDPNLCLSSYDVTSPQWIEQPREINHSQCLINCGCWWTITVLILGWTGHLHEQWRPSTQLEMFFLVLTCTRPISGFNFSPDKRLEGAVCNHIPKLMKNHKFAHACAVNEHVHSYCLNIFCWLYIIPSEQWNRLKKKSIITIYLKIGHLIQKFHLDGMPCLFIQSKINSSILIAQDVCGTKLWIVNKTEHSLVWKKHTWHFLQNAVIRKSFNFLVLVLCRFITKNMRYII